MLLLFSLIQRHNIPKAAPLLPPPLCGARRRAPASMGTQLTKKIQLKTQHNQVEELSEQNDVLIRKLQLSLQNELKLEQR